jgi:hypothetical protein
LKEVLQSLRAEWLHGELASRGYQGTFAAKDSCPATEMGAPPDGCALFYLNERFEPLAPPVRFLSIIISKQRPARCFAPPDARSFMHPALSSAANLGAFGHAL